MLDTTRLIDRADEARRVRAELEAAMRGFFLTDRMKARLTLLALDPPSEFDIRPRDLGLLEEVKA